MSSYLNENGHLKNCDSFYRVKDFFVAHTALIVTQNNDIVNIKFEGYALRGNGSYAFDHPLPKNFIQNIRLELGVYQTFSCIPPRENTREFCRPIYRFSIALN